MKLTKNSVTILIEILFPLFTSEFRNVFLWVRFSGQFYSLLKVKLLFTCRDFFMIFIYPFKGSSNKIAARNPQQTVMISNDYSVIIPGIMMINFSKWEKKVFLINHYELFDNVLVRMVVEEKVCTHILWVIFHVVIQDHGYESFCTILSLEWFCWSLWVQKQAWSMTLLNKGTRNQFWSTSTFNSSLFDTFSGKVMRHDSCLCHSQNL